VISRHVLLSQLDRFYISTSRSMAAESELWLPSLDGSVR
jgi:hypothetical protein